MSGYEWVSGREDCSKVAGLLGLVLFLANPVYDLYVQHIYICMHISTHIVLYILYIYVYICMYT